jgi:hypothetical protein
MWTEKDTANFIRHVSNYNHVKIDKRLAQSLAYSHDTLTPLSVVFKKQVTYLFYRTILTISLFEQDVVRPDRFKIVDSNHLKDAILRRKNELFDHESKIFLNGISGLE